MKNASPSSSGNAAASNLPPAASRPVFYPHLRLQPVFARRKRAQRSGSADVSREPPCPPVSDDDSEKNYREFEKVIREAGTGIFVDDIWYVAWLCLYSM